MAGGAGGDRLLGALRDHGLMERTVIVFTSDHGEGLNQHDWPAHGRIHEGQLRVPLLIRFPDPHQGTPRRFEALTSLIDVFPTVLARLDLPATREFVEQASGVDVLAPGFRDGPSWDSAPGAIAATIPDRCTRGRRAAGSNSTSRNSATGSTISPRILTN